MRSHSTKSLVFALPLVLVAACSLIGKSSDSSISTGAPNPNGAVDGASCQMGTDCKSGVCQNNSCTAPINPDSGTPQCGVSLGGAPCPNGQACQVAGDCTSMACVQKVCQNPTDTDGVQDGSETDIDCGGSGMGAATMAPPCADGKKCNVGGDCTSLVCTGNVCQVPTATDGVKNGSETDIDCGSDGTGENTNAPPCAVGQACLAHADCASSACNYNFKCVAQKSCTAHHGGDTCGPGEADATHESCCTQIAIPGQSVMMDKYNITAGRMRQFVERTGGNMRAFANAYTGSWWSHNWDNYLPTMLDNGGISPDDAPAFTGVYQELGPIVHAPGAAGANEGCYISGNGARTFRLPDDVDARMKDPQYYTQDASDEKALNCVTAYIVAAFCAWDGGMMPTRAQWNAAWGGSTYPWGTQAPAGYDNAYPADPNGMAGREAYGMFESAPFKSAPFPTTDLEWANYNYNYWGTIANLVATDYTIYIAPPGRFPNGNSSAGFSDLAGNVFNFQELTSAGPAMVNWSKSGSWQGHPIPYTSALTTSASNKYWAAGGRCAYN